MLFLFLLLLRLLFSKESTQEQDYRVVQEERVLDLESKLEETQKQLEACTAEKEEAARKHRNKVKAMNTKINKLSGVTSDLTCDIEDLKEQLKTSISEASRLGKELEETKKTISDIPSMSEKKKAETIRSLRTENRNLKRDLKESESIKSEAMVNKAKNDMTLTDYRNQNNRYKTMLAAKQGLLEAATNHIKQLKKSTKSFQEG